MQLVIYMLQVTGCLAIFYAFYHLLLQRQTTFRFNRIYLLITLCLSMVLPLVKIYIDAQHVASVIIPPQLFMYSYINTMETVTVESPSENSFPWKYLFLSLYAGGVLFMSFRLIRDLFRIREIGMKGTRMGINGFSCILSPEVRAPFSFFNRVFLPVNHGFSQDELAKIINHENAHIKGAHTIDVLGLEIASVFLWCSPMIYLYKRKLREVHEYLADAAVITTDHWEHYAQLLVAQKQYGLQNSLSNHLVYSQLKNRLIMMTKKPSSAWSAMRYMGFLPVLIIAVIIFSFRERTERGSIRDENMSNNFGSVLFDADTITKGSVRVMSNGYVLQENEDYIIDYASGLIKVINPAYLEPGIPINVSFDNAIQDKPDTMPTTYIRAFRLPNSSTEQEETKNDVIDSREVFTYVEQMPRFGNCDPLSQKEWVKCNSEALYNFINKTISYPAEARKNGIKGMVLIQFIIEADGALSNIKIIRGVSPELDKEALRVVNLMNEPSQKWIPGYNYGKPVAVMFTLPITFALSNKTNESISSEEPYTFVEQMPNFPCDFLPVEERGQNCSTTALFNFIHSAIKYPKKDNEQGNEGTVIVRFIVEADGTVSNVNVVRGVSPGLNEEAMRVVHSMNDLPYRWTPGMHNGQAVRVQFTLPFKFVLQQDSKKEQNAEIGDPETKEKISTPEIEGILFPNPANSTITIELPEDAHTVHIIDAMGINQMTKKINNGHSEKRLIIDITSLVNGKYFVQIATDEKTETREFVILR